MTHKTIPVKEFRELGYLQELNRRFLHPLGLALSVEIDDDGNEKLGDIWDSREDPDGIHFGFQMRPECAEMVDRELESRKDARLARFGAVVQPIRGGSNASVE